MIRAISGAGPPINNRIDGLLNAHLQSIYRGTDHLLAALMFFQWSLGILAAKFIMPRTWIGETNDLTKHIWGSILLSGGITALAASAAWFRPGKVGTRHAIAVAQMLMAGVLIHQLGGRIETHFYVFGSLAFLAFYRDWKVLVTATVVTSLDHLVRNVWWPHSVFGVATVSPWRWLEHVGWLVFADVFLIRSCRLGMGEMRSIATRRAELEATNEIIDQEVRHRTAELTASEEKYRRLVEGLRNEYFFLSYDGVGMMRYVSPSIENVLGYTQQDFLQRSDHYFTHDDAAELFRRNLRRALAGESIRSYEVAMNHHTEGPRVLELLLVPVLDEKGQVTSVEGIARDISEQKQAEEKLHRAWEEAEAANRAKTVFLENVSHELRTPMNGIIGLTELTLDTHLAPVQREYLSQVKSSADSLLLLLNNVLEFAALDAGRCELVPAPFDLRALIEGALANVKPQADAKALTLTSMVESDVPRRLVGDRRRLTQLLIALLDNAVKFSHDGGVTIRVILETDQDARANLHFTVSDTGIGISPEKLDRIFRAFEQADNASTRHYGGTGLGLAIAARLVHAMGGRMWVDSAVDRGSDFHFVLAFPVAPHPSQSNGAASDSQADDEIQNAETLHASRPSDAGRAWKILLAEDNPTNQVYAVGILRKQGFAVTVASNGRQAIDEMEKASFDLVLMDLQMPEMDGFQATAWIRNKEAATDRRTPIIALTAHANREQCLAAGIDGFVAKPIRSPLLFAEIDRVMANAQRESGSELEADFEPVPIPQEEISADAREDTRPSHLSVFDGEELLRRVNQDRALLAELLQLFQEDSVSLLATLREAVSRNDGPVIARTAHTFKGMAASLCSGSTTQAAMELEMLGTNGSLRDAGKRLTALEAESERLRIALESFLDRSSHARLDR